MGALLGLLKQPKSDERNWILAGTGANLAGCLLELAAPGLSLVRPPGRDLPPRPEARGQGPPASLREDLAWNQRSAWNRCASL